MTEPWYSVKCLFDHPTRAKEGEDHLYEERITLWRASSFEEAHRLAEQEARRYAAEVNCLFIGSTDSFHLFDDDISHGCELYSVMRGSNMTPSIYRSTFCITKRDRAKPLNEN